MGILDLFAPGEAEAATYQGFVKQFPKLVTVEGRKELRKLGLLDDDGRMYVGTLEPEVFEALKKRDKSVFDDNVWISRHAADQRLRDGVEPKQLAQNIAELIDSKDAKVLGNFPSKYPQPDHAKWMLAGRTGDSYTAAPLRTGEWGDVELKTVFEPQYDKKTYLDRMDWGGPRLPYMFTMTQLPWQSISQPQGLSAVSQPFQDNILTKADTEVNPGSVSQEPGLGTPYWDPIDGLVAPIGAVTWGSRLANMVAEPVINYGIDRALGGILGLMQQRKPSGGGSGI